MKSYIQYWTDTTLLNKTLCAQLYIICCDAALLILKENTECHWTCSEFICMSVYAFYREKSLTFTMVKFCNP